MPNAATTTTNPTNPDERGGVRTPEVYDGTPSKFRLFKQQVRLYLAIHADCFSTDMSKILFTLSYIRGSHCWHRTILHLGKSMQNLWELDRILQIHLDICKIRCKLILFTTAKYTQDYKS